MDQASSRMEPDMTHAALETRLHEIWSIVLSRTTVGIDENFFAAGGDSILALRLIARMRKAGMHITPRQLLEHSTIRELAQLAARQSDEDGEIEERTI